MPESLGEAVINVRGDTSHLKTDVERGVRKDLARVKGDKEGERVGREFGKGFNKGSNNSGGLFGGKSSGINSFGKLNFSLFKVAAGASAALTSVAPVPGALEGVAAAAVAVTGAVGLAGGALITLGVAGSSLVAGAGAVKVATLGLADAFKAQQKAADELIATGKVSDATNQALYLSMRKLSPAAQNLVLQVRALSKEWTGVRKATQQALFTGSATALKSLSGKFLPTVRKNLVGIAGDLNTVGRGFIANLGSPAGVKIVNQILTSMRANLRNIVPAIGQVVAGFAILFTGATGPAATLSKQILDIATQFRVFAQSTVASGKFTKFLVNAGVAAKALLHLTASLGKVLAGVFGAGASQGVTLIGALADRLDALSATIRSVSGQSALAGFFGTINVAGKAFADIMSTIRPVLSGVGDVLHQLNPALEQLRVALLPIVQLAGSELGQALKIAAPLIAGLVTSVAALASAFDKLPGPIRATAVAVGILALTMSRLKFASFGGSGKDSVLGAFGSGLSALPGKFYGAAAAGNVLRGSIAGVGAAIKANRLLSVGVGLAGVADSANRASKGMGALEGAASGALTGAALGSFFPGPGTAIGATIGGIAGALFGAAKAGKAAGDGFKIAAGGTDLLLASLNPVTAALTDQSRAAALAALTQGNLLSVSRALGFADNQVITAVLHQGAERAKLTQALNGQITAAQHVLSLTEQQIQGDKIGTAAGAALSDSRRKAAQASIAHANALLQELGATDKARQRLLELRVTLASGTRATDAAISALVRFGNVTATPRVNINGISVAIGAVNRLVNLISALNGGGLITGSKLFAATVLAPFGGKNAPAVKAAQAIVDQGKHAAAAVKKAQEKLNTAAAGGGGLGSQGSGGSAAAKKTGKSAQALLNELTAGVRAGGKRLVKALADIRADLSAVPASAREALRKLVDGFSQQVTRISSQLTAAKAKLATFKTQFADLAKSIAEAFVPQDLFSGSLSQLQHGLTRAIANVQAAIKAQATLIAAGVSPTFVSNLLSSGNAKLAVQLAADPAQAKALSAQFDQLNTFAKSLGRTQAKAVFNPQITTTNNLIVSLNKKMDVLAVQIGHQVGGALRSAIGHNASGTTSWRGGPTYLAERGPELVNLPRGSRVMNAQSTRTALAAPAVAGALTVEQNYYGPTTSYERQRELDWTIRYATNARQPRTN